MYPDTSRMGCFWLNNGEFLFQARFMVSLVMVVIMELFDKVLTAHNQLPDGLFLSAFLPTQAIYALVDSVEKKVLKISHNLKSLR